MIHVIAVITAKPGKRDAVLKEFRANVPNVKAEPGCIEYGAAVDLDPGPSIQTKHGADVFVVIEKYQDLEALKAHAASAHMKAYAEKTRDLLADRKIYILAPT
jgi:quinol monooxygenase YgiN